MSWRTIALIWTASLVASVLTGRMPWWAAAACVPAYIAGRLVAHLILIPLAEWWIKRKG